MNKRALILFVRNPELGKVKTRLAKTAGDVAALKIYEELLRRTRAVALKVDAIRYVFYSEEIQLNDAWTEDDFVKKVQSEGDLGMRMQQAFKTVFEEGARQAVIIGSDLPDLKAEDIETAFQSLAEYDVVLGPSEDGGYYLLGLNKLIPEIFMNKSWSTENVLSETLADLKEKSILLLDEKNDIDCVEDVTDKKLLNIIKNAQQKSN
ncbi:MAG: TIGR04282 family arsenosugar biosynthesis glycosyltransferase [Flavobacteriaceae bacterium]|nr:TIGR04282 family arsenosugar biosynthesis glycosyltransferase [Flavobacteriaceae bacterium]